MPRRGGPKRARSDLDSGDSSDSDAGGQVQVKVARAGTAAAGAGEATADTAAARAASFAAMNRAGEEEAVAGTLLSVELWNFMVHVHFKLDLHKHANFVVGLNGSGKSSVMGAVMVALGSKPARVRDGVSNRGQFVRNTCTHGQVEVVLDNSGKDAFKPECFGPRIIVRRTIYKSGREELRMSSQGAVNGAQYVDKAPRRTLPAMLAHFNINIESPAVSMTQDDMKMKLGSSDPRKLFELFMRVSGLDASWRKMCDSQASLESATKSFAACEIKLKKAEAELHAAKSLHEGCAQFHEMEGRIEAQRVVTSTVQALAELQRPIADAEKAVDKANAEKDVQQHVFDKAKHHFDALDKELEAKKEEAEAAKAELQSIREQLASFHAEKEHAKSKTSKLQEEVKRCRENVRTKRSAVSTAGQELKLAQEAAKASSEYQAALDAYHAEIQELQAGVRSAGVALADKKAELSEAEKEQEEQQAAIKDHEVTVKSLKVDAARIKQEIDVLVNPTSRGRGAAMQAAAAHASDPRMLPFPRSVQEARKIIQREAAAFSEPPVGPVGRYLSVQGDDSHLFSQVFLVNTPQDQATLFELLKRHKLSRVAVQVYPKSTSVDIAQHLRPGTLAEKILVEDTWVHTALLDFRMPGEVVYAGSKAEASRIMKGEQSVPSGVCSILTDTALRRRNAKGHWTSSAFGSERPVVHVSVEAQVAALREELAGNAEAQTQAAVQLRELRAAAKAAIAKRSQINREFDTLESSKRGAQARLEGKRQEGEPPKPPQQSALEAALQAALDALEEADQMEHLARKELHKTEGRLTKQESVLASLSGKVDRLQSRADKLDPARLAAARDKLLAKTQQAVAECDEANKAVLELTMARDAALAELGELKSKVEDTLASTAAEAGWSATKMEEVRGMTLRAAEEELQGMLAQQAKVKRAMERDGLDVEKLARKVARKQEVYDETQASYAALQDTLGSLRVSVAQRKRKWQALFDSTSERFIDTFSAYMSKRGHFGLARIEVDPAAGGDAHSRGGSLTLSVAPDCHSRRADFARLTQGPEEESEDRSASQFADMGALSGGEKSFCKVAFVSALWECVEVPFVMLDEFDVFMDEATRTEAMKQLLRNAAHMQGQRQFLFITPHDISSAVPASDDFVKVYRIGPANAGAAQ